MSRIRRVPVVRDCIDRIQSIIALLPYDDEKHQTILLLTPEELKARLQRVSTELINATAILPRKK